jgi:hypothetical protein
MLGRACVHTDADALAAVQQVLARPTANVTERDKAARAVRVSAVIALALGCVMTALVGDGQTRSDALAFVASTVSTAITEVSLDCDVSVG